MFKINQKRITIIISAVCISLFAFSFQMAQEKQTKENINNKKITVVTTATPVSGKTVILDAGHGTPDERCRK